MTLDVGRLIEHLLGGAEPLIAIHGYCACCLARLEEEWAAAGEDWAAFPLAGPGDPWRAYRTARTLPGLLSVGGTVGAEAMAEAALHTRLAPPGVPEVRASRGWRAIMGRPPPGRPSGRLRPRRPSQGRRRQG